MSCLRASDPSFTMRCAAVLLGTLLSGVLAAPPAAYSFGYDVYNPQEDVFVQAVTYVDASAGAAASKAALNTTTADGNYDTMLLRNDLGNALYMIVPRYGNVVRGVIMRVRVDGRLGGFPQLGLR